MYGVRFVREVKEVGGTADLWVMHDAETSWEVGAGDQIKLFGEFMRVEAVTHFYPPARVGGDREINMIVVLQPEVRVSKEGFGETIERMQGAGWKVFEAEGIVAVMRGERGMAKP